MFNKKEWNKEYRSLLKQEALDHYGKVCKRCGFSDVRALHIDHVENNGNTERAQLGSKSFSGWNFYHWLKQQNWPEGYQTLCANCNIIKHVEFIARSFNRQDACL